MHQRENERGSDMADLIAIGYPDETTAIDAQQEAERLPGDLVIQADAIAAIVRQKDGKYKVTTNHHAVAGGTAWGMWWGLLFGLLFFVPVFGMAIGAGFGALFGVVEKVTPDKAIEHLRPFGGTVLKTSLSEEVEAELQAELSSDPKKQ